MIFFACLGNIDTEIELQRIFAYATPIAPA